VGGTAGGGAWVVSLGGMRAGELDRDVAFSS